MQGVVLDADGAPVTYCIDNFDANNPGVVEEKEVRARDRYGRLVVIHVHNSPPTVVRGISPMAPAIQVVRQYDQLANATLTAALIQAIFAATIESDAPTEQLLGALQDEDEQATPANGGGQAGEAGGDFSRFMAARAQWYNHTKFDLGRVGKIMHVFPGEKLNFLRSEHPNSNYKPFAKSLLQEVARCLGITYEQLTGDREGATYSSERMGGAEIWLINQHRRQHIAGRFMQIAYESWLEEDIELGETEVPGGIEAILRPARRLLPGRLARPAEADRRRFQDRQGERDQTQEQDHHPRDVVRRRGGRLARHRRPAQAREGQRRRARNRHLASGRRALRRLGRRIGRIRRRARAGGRRIAMAAIDWSDPCARAKALWDAYNRLISGSQESDVTYSANGVNRRVSYSNANLDRLLNEYRAAENECALLSGKPVRWRRFAITAGSRRFGP